MYEARDTRLERSVAIKVLSEDFLADDERMRRFEREARLLARLNHPHIAVVHEVGEDKGKRFLVMERISGETLAERIVRGPMALGEAVRVAAEIASALEAAYQHGIVHRDLKPANAMLTRHGVKLLDFGLAKAPPTGNWGEPGDPTVTARHRITASGVVLGTLGYMSPEQARGRAVDARTDLWALGVILWEMLTGSSLFGGNSAADTLAAVLGREIDFSDLPVSTPDPVRRLLRRLLSRNPEYRLRHPGDAWLELEEARRHEADENVWNPRGAAAEAPRASLESFQLTTEVCRALAREHLVPEMIGDELVFLDNARASEVLAVYIPSLGNDHEQYREAVESSPYRGLAVTPYGWQESAVRRPPLALHDHLTILGRFLDEMVRRIQPTRTVLVGFSSGADMAMRLPLEAQGRTSPLDGILALGPNVTIDTCFFTDRLARIRSDSPDDMLETIRQIEASTESLEEWISLAPYLVQVASRFGSHSKALRRVAGDVVEPFQRSGRSPFAAWYRALKQEGIAVGARFCNSSYDQEALASLRLKHLEAGILGPDFDDRDLVMEKHRNHFQLLDPDLIAEAIGEFMKTA